MDELEKKLEEIRLRRERNKVWIEASKSNHAEVKKKNSSETNEKVVASLEEEPHVELGKTSIYEEGLPLVEAVFCSIKELFFLSPLGKKRRSDAKLFIMSESYMAAYKSKVIIDSKKHRAIKLS